MSWVSVVGFWFSMQSIILVSIFFLFDATSLLINLSRAAPSLLIVTSLDVNRVFLRFANLSNFCDHPMRKRLGLGLCDACHGAVIACEIAVDMFSSSSLLWALSSFAVSGRMDVL